MKHLPLDVQQRTNNQRIVGKFITADELSYQNCTLCIKILKSELTLKYICKTSLNDTEIIEGFQSPIVRCVHCIYNSGKNQKSNQSFIYCRYTVNKVAKDLVSL